MGEDTKNTAHSFLMILAQNIVFLEGSILEGLGRFLDSKGMKVAKTRFICRSNLNAEPVDTGRRVDSFLPDTPKTSNLACILLPFLKRPGQCWEAAVPPPGGFQ